MPKRSSSRGTPHEFSGVFLSHTRLGGRLVMRIAIGNLRTERRHVAAAWELIRMATARA